MDDLHPYPVFFECGRLSPEQRRAIEKYFSIRRRCGGSDCGPLRIVNDGVYSIAFKDQTDQQKVLEKGEHVVQFSDGLLVFTVRGSLAPDTPTPIFTRDLTAAAKIMQSVTASTTLLSGEEYELQSDVYLLRYLKDCPEAGAELEKELASVACSAQLYPDEGRVLVKRLVQPHGTDKGRNWKAEVDKLFDAYLCHYEVDPHKVQALLQSCSSGQATGEVKVYAEDGLAVVVGKNGQVIARLEDVEESTVQSRRVLFGSDSLVTSLRHTKEVEELTETVAQFSQSTDHLSLPGLTSSSSLPSSLSLSEDNTIVASYALCGGLQVLVCQGDITKQYADALVNAANEDLDHCGGLAAALSEAGGPEIQRESDTLIHHFGKVRTGEAVVTTGGNLKCKKLLHAVGPSAGRAGGREGFLLVKTVQSALNMAEMMEFKSIAMPCISAGVFGVPLPVCAEAIVTAVKRFGSQEGRSLRKIILIDNRGEVVRAMQEACDRLLQGTSSGNTTPSDEFESLMGAAAQGTVKEDRAGPPGHSVHVEVVQGTIESQEVDALVSPMVGHDPLSTRVGNTLFKKVGDKLTAKFIQKAGEDTAPGDAVLVEGLSGLPSSAVFFLNLAPWKKDTEETAVEILRLCINNTLTSCEVRGFRSVALPVLGSGVALGFPTSLVARVLMEQVHEFKQTSRASLLVRIAIHPNDTEASEIFKEYKTHFYQRYQASTTKRIVVLGKTGSGKSNLANTILGEEELFATFDSPNSGTRKCQTETKSVNGRSISLIDTPGFFDSDRTEKDIRAEIVNCITECAPGPHAFLIVLKVDKFTEQEQDVVNKILQYFSEDALKYAVIVFTHGNQLSEGKTIEEFVSKSKNLSDLVKKCGGRCHVFDNKYWKNQQHSYRSNEFQVEELLKTIDKMVMENNGDYYTNEMLQVVEEEIKAEEDLLKQSTVNQSEEEIRQQARANVSNKFLIGLTATATGALLGAFFGVRAMVGLVITVVKNKTFRSISSQIPALRAPAAKVVAAAAGGELAVAAAAAGGELAIAGAVAGAFCAVAGGVAGGKIGLEAAEQAETPGEAADMAYKAVTGAWDQWSNR